MSTYTAVTVPTQFVEANGIRFAYRRWGKRSGLPLVFNQHFTGNLDNWDPAVLDGLAKEREVIIFNNAGVASSTGEVPTTFPGMAKNAEAFIGGLGLTKVDLLGFSIGGMVAQQITLDRPDLIRKLILVGTAPRNHDAGNGQGHITPETAAIFGATYNPPENLWLKVFFTDTEKSQAAGRAFLKRYLSRTENRDTPISDKVAPAQIAAIGEWGSHPGERFAYLKNIKQPAAHIAPGREGLFDLIKSLPPTLKYEHGTIVGEGDFVIVHGRFSNFGLPVNWIAADIVRIKDGVLVEHWDVIQDEATQEQSRVVSQCSAARSRPMRVPDKKQIRRIVLEEAQPHESGHCSWRSISQL